MNMELGSRSVTCLIKSFEADIIDLSHQCRRSPSPHASQTTNCTDPQRCLGELMNYLTKGISPILNAKSLTRSKIFEPFRLDTQSPKCASSSSPPSCSHSSSRLKTITPSGNLSNLPSPLSPLSPPTRPPQSSQTSFPSRLPPSAPPRLPLLSARVPLHLPPSKRYCNRCKRDNFGRRESFCFGR